jgi:hypothetical protein
VLLEELKTITDVRAEEEVFRALDSLESVLMISATNCPYIGMWFHPFRVLQGCYNGSTHGNSV